MFAFMAVIRSMDKVFMDWQSEQMEIEKKKQSAGRATIGQQRAALNG